jgi:dUTP pyrophosphatase
MIDDILKVKLLNEHAALPERKSTRAAGYDLFACESCTIQPFQRALVSTGIAIEIPSCTYGRIAPRSGLSVKGIDVGAGVIDEDYRGEIKILLINNSSAAFTVAKGERVAQLILECIATPRVEQVNELSDTDRRDRGFGSSGV